MLSNEVNMNATKNMTGYLIDPELRIIKPFVYDGNWRTIAPALGCEFFTVVTFHDNGDCVFVDDEGLLSNPLFFLQH